MTLDPPALGVQAWLTARWKVSFAVAVAGLVIAGVAGRLPATTSVGCLLFFTSGATGYRRARRWTRGLEPGRAEADDAPAGRIAGLRMPQATAPAGLAMAALGVPFAVTRGWGVGAVLLALAGMTAAGRDLAAAVVVEDWERRTGHLLLGAPRAQILLHRGRLWAVPSVRPARGRSRTARWLPALLAGGVVLGIFLVGQLEHPLPTVAWAHGPTHVDRRLSAVSAALVGHPVSVSCWSTADWRASERALHLRLGGITTQAGRIYVTPEVCGWLAWAGRTHAWPRDAGPRFRLAEAAGVLAHESGHVLLGSDETTAECFAYDHVAFTLERLGFDEASGEAAQREFQERVHPRLPPRYRLRSC